MAVSHKDPDGDMCVSPRKAFIPFRNSLHGVCSFHDGQGSAITYVLVRVFQQAPRPPAGKPILLLSWATGRGVGLAERGLRTVSPGPLPDLFSLARPTAASGLSTVFTFF